MRSKQDIFTPQDIAIGGKYKLPGSGSRFRGDVFQYAHMMLVKRLIGTEYITANFCIDMEAGLARGMAALCSDEIKAGRIHIAEINFEKGLTNDAKTQLAAEGAEHLKAALKRYGKGVAVAKRLYPWMRDIDAVTLFLVRSWAPGKSPQERGFKLAQKGYPWVFYDKAEPLKTIYLKTDLDTLGWAGLAHFLVRASVHPVDAYFNLARRRLTAFERGLPTASNEERIWHAYSLYRPELVPKLATILRFYHNYMLPRGRSGEKATPAMKLGLARGLVYE